MTTSEPILTPITSHVVAWCAVPEWLTVDGRDEMSLSKCGPGGVAWQESAVVARVCVDVDFVQLKNDNFTIGTRRAHREPADISPRGEPWSVVPAQCPHAPVTLHCNTCGGCRDALEGHYLCCSGLDK
jgi:hypothetical protein